MNATRHSLTKWWVEPNLGDAPSELPVLFIYQYLQSKVNTGQYLKYCKE